MMTLVEYFARCKKTTLPDAVTMLARAGIHPNRPHDVEVLRLTKAMKKAAEKAPGKGVVATVFRANRDSGCGWDRA